MIDYNLQNLLHKFIQDPESPENNFYLGTYYDNLGQSASAVSYYLRTAERSQSDLIKYQCILRAGLCFSVQGCRNTTVKGLFQHALAIQPKRPEGYFLMSRFYEREENYHDAYLIASIGEQVAEQNVEPLILNVEYPGFYGILFEKAVSSWWVGLCNESRNLLEDLLENYELDEIHKQAVENNLQRLTETSKGLHNVYLPKKYRDFDWGIAAENEWFRKTVEKEVFIDNVYQKFFKVEEGDIVFDVGASAGPFTHYIKNQKPGKIYCFEPHSELYQTLVGNVSDDNVVCVNKAIGSVDGEYETAGLFNETLLETCEDENLQTAPSVKFSTFVKENNISQIDFLKTDCEGGEYDMFNDENLSWVKNNVKKIAGEFHLGTPELKEKFRHFRDTYLKALQNYEIYSADYVNIKQHLYGTDNGAWFLDYYTTINLYIDNRFGGKDRWRNSTAPTMEFTTSIDTQNGCVVDCVFCPQRTLQKSYKGERFMTLDNFKKAVDKLPQEVRVTFAGFTEPWLNKQCTDMVLYAHEKGHPISIFTTGIGMSIEDIERIKHIPFAGNPNGCFTLHLPDQERKAKHPITKRYIEVIEHFGKIQNQIHNFTTMCMGTVHEDVRHVFPTAPVYDMWSRAGNLVGEMIMKPELLERKAEWKIANHGEKQMTCGCLEKMYHNVMLPNGDVSLCCMDYGLKHILGNLYEQDYEEIVPENNQCFELCRLCENAVEP
jgi:FkbM family methyltransferase